MGKHITLNKKMKGPDHFYAMEPGEFTDYVFRIHEAYKMLGRSEKDLIKFEKKLDKSYTLEQIKKDIKNAK